MNIEQQELKHDRNKVLYTKTNKQQNWWKLIVITAYKKTHTINKILKKKKTGNILDEWDNGAVLLLTCLFPNIAIKPNWLLTECIREHIPFFHIEKSFMTNTLCMADALLVVNQTSDAHDTMHSNAQVEH